MTNTSQPSATALAIIPRSVDEVRVLAKSMLGSALLPEAFRREPDIIAAVVAGLELGLPPMAALRGVHMIKGRPALSAATMVAVVLGRGLAEYFECVEDRPESVTYETKRVGGRNPQRATWTSADQRRAGLSGDNWTKFPSDMLHARCMARLARRAYPDVLAGIYTPDEVNHFDEPMPSRPMQSGPAADTADAEIVSEIREAVPVNLIDRILSAGSIDALRALARECNALPKGSPERMNAMSAYRQRETELKALAQADARPEGSAA